MHHRKSICITEKLMTDMEPIDKTNHKVPKIL